MGSRISFQGIGSGLPIDQIIEATLKSESDRIKLANNDKQITDNKINLNASIRSQLQNVSQAAANLSTKNAFTTLQSDSSAPSMVSINSVANTATAGEYNITTNQLATSHKISSSIQASMTNPLNQTGNMIVNGKNVNIVSTDTLSNIASKISSATNGKVTATVYGQNNTNYLTLTSSQSGSSNAIKIGDMDGAVARSLGLINGVLAPNAQGTNDVAMSYAFSSSTQPISSIMNITGAASKNLTINSRNVAVNFNTDSLQDIATKINATPNINVSASIVTNIVNNTNLSTLQIKNLNPSGNQANYVDNDHALEALGILQSGNPNEVIAAKDATFTIDNKVFTSPTNNVTNVIKGVSIQLLQAANPTLNVSGQSIIKLSTTTQDAVTKITALKDSFNAALEFFDNNSKFDPKTYESGPLSNNPIVNQFTNKAMSLIFENPIGASGTYNNLTQIGFGVSQGRITLDTTALNTALQKDPQSVQNLFTSYGASTASGLTYIADGIKTQSNSSTNPSYAVNVTRLATQASTAAQTAQTQVSQGNEILSFGGSMLGNKTYQLSLGSNLTLQDTINTINNDNYLKQYFSASNQAGKLKLTSNMYGAYGNFTVQSNLASANNNSGVGTGTNNYISGLDIQGTIGGFNASGSGQTLQVIGDQLKSQNKSLINVPPDLLQIRYSGTNTGQVGNITYSKGVAGDLNRFINSFTDPLNGTIANDNKNLQTRSDQIVRDIERYFLEQKARESELRKKFQDMEDQIARSQQQGQQLSAMGMGNMGGLASLLS